VGPRLICRAAATYESESLLNIAVKKMPSAFSTDRPSGHNNEPCSFCFFYLLFIWMDCIIIGPGIMYEADGVAVTMLCVDLFAFVGAIILLLQLGFTIAHSPLWV
jgi:hypothetical protein